MCIWDYLEKAGYEHYEVSNFARDGKRCIHNCRYWEYRQYVGLGPGAASTAFSADGDVTRFVFEPSVKAYVSKDVFDGVESEVLSDEEATEELVLMGLRHRGGLDLGRLGVFMHRGLDMNLFEGLAGFRVESGFLVPDDEGLMTADAAAGVLLGRLCSRQSY